MFVNHFKLIEKILLYVDTSTNLINVIENFRLPIFFKKRNLLFINVDYGTSGQLTFY